MLAANWQRFKSLRDSDVVSSLLRHLRRLDATPSEDAPTWTSRSAVAVHRTIPAVGLPSWMPPSGHALRPEDFSLLTFERAAPTR
jgi:hypothetical protein